MTRIEEVKSELKASPKKWLITGVAGFIGSNLLEELLKLGQTVAGLDNLSSGYMRNLEDVEREVGEKAWSRFTFYEGDIENLDHCRKACENVDYVLHEAAVCSVPKSLEDPIGANRTNVDGFLNMLVAARDNGVRRFVYASSSAVYGDGEGLPKVEESIGKPLSPYGLGKYANELYAGLFRLAYGVESAGLRYFNVFGKRQDPNGAYAAVIPKWISAFLNSERPLIFGDGETTRDFCFIHDVVQANLLAAVASSAESSGQVFNVGCGADRSLNDLYRLIRKSLVPYANGAEGIEPSYAQFRDGDIRYSYADIGKIRRILGYEPVYGLEEGIGSCIGWYVENEWAGAGAQSTQPLQAARL